MQFNAVHILPTGLFTATQTMQHQKRYSCFQDKAIPCCGFIYDTPLRINQNKLTMSILHNMINPRSDRQPGPGYEPYFTVLQF